MSASKVMTWLATVATLAAIVGILSAVWFEASTVVLAANTVVGTVAVGFGTLTVYASRQNESVLWFLPAPAAVSGLLLVAIAVLGPAEGLLLYAGIASGAVVAITAGAALAIVIVVGDRTASVDVSTNTGTE